MRKLPSSIIRCPAQSVLLVLTGLLLVSSQCWAQEFGRPAGHDPRKGIESEKARPAEDRRLESERVEKRMAGHETDAVTAAADVSRKIDLTEKKNAAFHDANDLAKIERSQSENQRGIEQREIKTDLRKRDASQDRVYRLDPVRGAEVSKVAERAAITVRAEQGTAREAKVAESLKAENPGASVQNQQYLRNAEGNIAKDPVTGEGRRVDHAVIQNGSAKTVETTSLNADKTAQTEKEQRILDSGGTKVRDRTTGDLIPVEGLSELRRLP